MQLQEPAGETARHRIPERGFGLIELAIALVVLAIGVLGLAAVIPAGTRSTAKSGEVTRASEMASQVAERLLATPYSHAELDPGTHNSTTWPMSGNYYVSWFVEADQPIAACKRVTVRVRWPSPAGPGKTDLVIVSPKANEP